MAGALPRIEATATGSGLGLSIVKRIAELHGGAVGFRNGATGRGLRVEVTIPAERRGHMT
ncbi:MAG: hypothetical protein IPJ97_07275 [Proteobacteria bacterium]|nr:hypothetical protein [Pseudomonadota bacterium]